MSNTIKAAMITGVAAIAAAIIGVSFGKSSEQKNIQNEIQSIMGNVVNITGNDNEVTINSIKDLVDEYQRLQSQNQSLLEQNSKYFSDLEEAQNIIIETKNQSTSKMQELEQQLKDTPNLQFKNIELSIDGEDIPINSINSSVIINNRAYYSDEFIKNIIDSNNNMFIKDNVMYVGKIIKEKSNLLEKWILNSNYVDYKDMITDSYGNIHTNALHFKSKYSNIKYNLNREYSLLQCNISVSDYSSMDRKGIITIKADDIIVYSSFELTKTSEPFKIEDIPINYCSLLTIEYISDINIGCILDLMS